MIGIIMSLYLLILGFFMADIEIRMACFIAAGLFYIGFVNSTK